MLMAYSLANACCGRVEWMPVISSLQNMTMLASQNHEILDTLTSDFEYIVWILSVDQSSVFSGITYIRKIGSNFSAWYTERFSFKEERFREGLEEVEDLICSSAASLACSLIKVQQQPRRFSTIFFFHLCQVSIQWGPHHVSLLYPLTAVHPGSSRLAHQCVMSTSYQHLFVLQLSSSGTHYKMFQKNDIYNLEYCRLGTLPIHSSSVQFEIR